jgi:hypothetical protein
MYDVLGAINYKCGKTDLHTTYTADLATDEPTMPLEELREYILANKDMPALYNEVAAHFGPPLGMAVISPFYSLEIEEGAKHVACIVSALLDKGATVMRYSEDNGVLSM